MWVQCSSFSTGLHDHTYHMIYLDKTKNPSFQQMFKQKRFLVETNSDFLFKKVRKYVNVNMYIWNFSTDPPTQKMKHMFHMIILCCTFHKTQKDDDGGDGDIIWQEKALFQKVCYEGCLIGSIDWFRGIFATEMHRDASHL